MPTLEPFEACRPGEVVIWLIGDAVERVSLARIMAALTTGERAEMRRLPAAHQRRFAFGRVALRQLIGRQLGIEPERVALVREAGGRPRLDPGFCSAVTFNLSYAGDKVLVALAENATVGVDIERILPIADQDSIVRLRYSKLEGEAWSQLAPEARRDAFYEAWTRKEATLKAMGVGLAFPLDRLTVTFGPEADARLVEIDGRTAHGVHLLDIAGIPGHKAALAVAPVEDAALRASIPLRVRRLPDWSSEGSASTPDE